MAQGSPEAADRYQEARRAAASVVMEAKARVWEEFGEAIGRRTFSWPQGSSGKPLDDSGGESRAQQGRKIADPDWGYCQAVERVL